MDKSFERPYHTVHYGTRDEEFRDKGLSIFFFID